MTNLKSVLMKRDGLTSKEADREIEDASTELMERLQEGESPYDFMEERFGLEPDYLMDLGIF